MKLNRLPQLSLLGACACAALTITPAWAAPVVLTSGSAAQTTAAAVPTGTSPSTTYTNSFSQAPSGPTGTASASGWASQFGAYAVRSSAEGIGSGNSFVKLLYSLTNSNSTAEQYSMSFHIYGGTLSAALNTHYTPPPTWGTGEFLTASYATTVAVTKNAATTTAFASQATITNSSSGVAVTQTGQELVGAATNSAGFYSWNTADYFVDLGLVGAGETFSVEIDLLSSVQANVGTYDFGGGGGGGTQCFGGRNPVAQIEPRAVAAPQLFKGCANAFYGDPINFSSSNGQTGLGQTLSSFSSRAAQVPEPGSLPLAALALLGAGAALRRRRA